MSAKSKAKAKPKKATTTSNGRLRPGERDGLVLGYMRKHKKQLPLTATAIAKGIDRSGGAVANCLERLVKAGQARLAKNAPREYDLEEVGSR